MCFLILKVYHLCVISSQCVGRAGGGVSLSYVFPVSSIQWPSWFHVCLVSSFSICCCPVCLHNSSSRILHGHQVCRMLLRHLITCKVFFSSLVNLQVSAPYKSTAFAFELVLVLSGMNCRHIRLSIMNTPELATSLICFLAIITPSPYLAPTQKLVFVALTFKLTFSLCSSKEVSCPACSVLLPVVTLAWVPMIWGCFHALLSIMLNLLGKTQRTIQNNDDGRH